MSYQHCWVDGSAIDLPVGKVVCVGRNYAAHAKELGNEVPDAPILFIKPASSIVPMNTPLALPQGQGEVHHEVEIALLVSERMRNVDAKTAPWKIAGYGIGLDLTLRDLQSELKAKGHPWERAKSFDGACPLSGFVDARGISGKQPLNISLAVNGAMRQQGSTTQMLFPIFELIAQMSEIFTLEPGDVVLTGTPSGVAALHSGDVFHAKLGNALTVEGSVA
ncbi:MAG: fumarylacetoacetate hydrolase family protein [Alcanivoracaceae bacterium]|nr:fumarylacetoacetate hydrolase family protein [Alcanivoracaceae bacterium]